MTAIGAGLTTFLLVAVGVIELLDFEFSAIIGLPVGLLAWLRFEDLSRGARRLASAYGTVGIVALVLLALRYVDVGRNVFSVDVIAGAGVAAAIAVYVALLVSDKNSS